MSHMENLSAAILRELLDYDASTGVFTRKKAVARKTKIGAIAGWVDANGYVQITVNGKRYKGHRLAWMYVHGEFPSGVVDHINGNRADNRISNLRDVSMTENAHNRRCANRNSKTGLMGASLHRPSGRWKAQIRINYKSIHLGVFNTPEEVHRVYLEAKRKVHGGCTI